MSQEENNQDPAQATGEAPQEEGQSARSADPMSDLSELEKIKKELELEKAKAARELEEGEEEEEDLREVDYLQKLITLCVQFDHHVGMFLMPGYIITLCVQFDHHVGMFLMPGYIDCGLKYNHKLADSYMKHLATIQGFLRLLEKVDGVTREAVTKDCIIRLRNVIQEIHKNLVKPLYKEVDLMKKKPKMENLDNFKNHWNERLSDLQSACDFEYQVLDVKGFMVN